MYEYKTKDVCSSKITFDVVNNTVKDVKFYGGCNGNSKGIGSLVEGMEVDEVIKKIEGTRCGLRGSSCPDQLAIALKAHRNKND